MFFAFSRVLSTRWHLAHPVSVLILHPINREIQDMWSQYYDTEILHRNAVKGVGFLSVGIQQPPGPFWFFIYVLVRTIPVYSEYNTYYVFERLVMSWSIRLSRKDCLPLLHNVLPRHFYGRLSGPCRHEMVASSVPCNIRWSVSFGFFFFVPFQLGYLRPSGSRSFPCVNSGPGSHSTILPAPHYGTPLAFYRE